MTPIASARALAAGLLAFFLSAALPAGAQLIVIDERIGDERVGYLDPEFWPAQKQIVWQEYDGGAVWLAGVNEASGALNPASGKGRRLGTAAPMENTFNGPEFGFSTSGPAVYFTGRDRNGVLQAFRTRLGGRPARPQQLSIGPIPLYGLLPSQDAQDPLVRLQFWRGVDSIYWAYENDVLNETLVQHIDSVSFQGPRWIAGEHAMLTTLLVDGVIQIARADVLTGEVVPLTSDTDEKTDAFFYDAPEFGGERVMMCLVNGESIGVYRDLDGNWTRVFTTSIPGDFPRALYSAEPFVWKDQSWTCTGVQIVGDESNREIWMLSLDPTRPLARRVNLDQPQLRFDPEAYVTASQVLIYYYTLTDVGGANELHVCRVFGDP